MPHRVWGMAPRPFALQPAAFSIAVVMTVLLALAAGCGGSKSNSTSVRYPAGVPLLAVAEEHGATTEFWLIDPRDELHRWKFATVPHRQDWGVRASVAPDGKTLVYAAMGKDARDASTEADLWALPVNGRNPRRLATGIDLRSGLVWTPDSTWVSYERQSGADSQLRRANVSAAGDQLIARSTPDSRWYLMGYQPDVGTPLLAHLSAAGTEVVTQPIGAAATGRSQVATGPSRDFTVSPEGRPALLLLTSENGHNVYRAVARGTDGSFTRLTDGGVEDTGIAWDPRTQEPSIGVVPSTAGGPVPAAPGAHTVVPAAGFDVPLAWSPDASYLAVRHFSGGTTDQPGGETLDLVRTDNTRSVVIGSVAPEFAGWMVPVR
jgi:hypothetical protein